MKRNEIKSVARPAAAQVVDFATNGDTSAPPPAQYHGTIGLGTWNATAEFKDVVVTSSNGAVLYRSDFAKEGTAGWTVLRGAWGVKDEVFQETFVRPQCRAIFGDTNWANYTITLRARKTGGEEGFNIYFNYLDANNWSYFNVGGWTNSAAGVQSMTDGGAWRRRELKAHGAKENFAPSCVMSHECGVNVGECSHSMF